MAELVKDKEEESSLSAVESAQRRETKHSRTFLNVTSEEGASSLLCLLLEKMQQRFCFRSWTGKFKKVSYIPIELFTFLIC